MLISSLSIFLGLGLAHAAPPNVWDVLRSQLAINHEAKRPEVQAQIHWLAAHPGYLQQLRSAEPYLYDIIRLIKQKGLPGELALLPMIESAYNPFAYSGKGAAGLWQIMPGTGSGFGLQQDWWFDGRRSIRSSTEAALHYLQYLHKFFHGDWLLAIAAYDAGEGTISKAIQSSGQNVARLQFWGLPVPNETKNYIPRFLALAEMIQHPESYNITLPHIALAPYFEEVEIGSQIDLNHAAKLAGMSFRELIKLNPGYNRFATAPNQPFKLLIPANKVAIFRQNLSQVPKDERVSLFKYHVRLGETLESIANQYFTTAKLIYELNALKTKALQPNQLLLLPSIKNALAVRGKQAVFSRPASPATVQTFKVIHIVQAKEDFKALEQHYQVTLKDIRQWNQLEENAALHTGQELVLWQRKIIPGVYVVGSGENLRAVAIRNHTTVDVLKRLNPRLRENSLRAGARVLIGSG